MQQVSDYSAQNPGQRPWFKARF